ncbi:uncharacterized protein LOC129909225 [Episyrphus balteatus]|uniref:uncharacterized protein LOC129909225 n=1 Tax=Episyrphus balteatus TaxID=286459 RepID=UPI002485B814|nr:uncharacterized protein LOC129909225 [Episyrphus balteatus]XP_055842243.1 uncharacterized protein LOC129909225 [Episyrphus balteatus]
MILKNYSCLTIKLTILILLINYAGSIPDYGSSENEQLYTADAPDDHEIYDPAQLQQEVEDEEDIIHKQTNLDTGGHTAYYDSQEDTTDMMLGDGRDDATIKISRTTMVPEYVRRQQKSYEQHSSTEDYDSTPVSSSTSAEDQTAPDSNYMDMMGPIELTQRNESVPLAMKSNVLYSDENDLHDIQNQQLENSNSSVEEEYYEDAPESIEELYPSSLLGTTTINVPPPPPPLITTTSAPPLPPMPSSSLTTTQSTTPPVGTDATTTTTNRAKQGKQIHMARRKLLPHEQLRNYIEDAYIRMPLAVIVDPSPESLEKTKALWREALRSNFAIKIVLVALNASGTPTAYSFNNTRQFLAGLNSIKESSGGNAFIGVVHASELVPYDSAVFISTASIPAHTELVQDAAITLLKKRIRLYLVWYGERLETENETQEAVGGILGEVAVRSGGEILHVVGNETYQELEGMTLTMIADTYLGSQEIDIPVDTTLSSLHVKIDSLMRTATLETPNGDINLKKLVKFKSRLLSLNENQLDAFVPLTKVKKSTTFKLKLIPELLDKEYNVFVRADRKADIFLDDMIRRLNYVYINGLPYTRGERENIIATHDSLRFPEETTDPDSEIFPVFSITNDKNKTNIIQEKQTTLSNGVLKQGITKIEMGIQSQILVAPGMLASLYFEVTNLRTEPIFHNIQVTDEQRFLRTLTPQSIFLESGQTTTVTVTVLIPNTTPQGTRDTIKFMCLGSGRQVFQSVELKVITNIDAEDTTPPSVSWQFGSRCDSIRTESAGCSDKYWSLDIVAQDWETGLLRLQSLPSGLINRNSFTVGTNQALRTTYSASCCQPKVTLIAYDIAGNQKTHNIDVRDMVLSEASIAAIVLGALLLILLIILIVILIMWCLKRRRASHDLHSYRSHSQIR